MASGTSEWRIAPARVAQQDGSRARQRFRELIGPRAVEQNDLPLFALSGSEKQRRREVHGVFATRCMTTRCELDRACIPAARHNPRGHTAAFDRDSGATRLRSSTTRCRSASQRAGDGAGAAITKVRNKDQLHSISRDQAMSRSNDAPSFLGGVRRVV
jgi:hypothetical protein